MVDAARVDGFRSDVTRFATAAHFCDTPYSKIINV